MTTNQPQVTVTKPVNATGQVNGKPTYEELMARVTQLESMVNTNNAITYKCYAKGEKYTDGQGVTREGKGCLIVMGLGQFPWSPYKSQALRIIEEVKSGRFEAALERFKDKLASKS
jgi:hypothetical protein